MERDTLSFSQLMALIFGALIGPVTELLPGTAVLGGVLGAICSAVAVGVMACAGICVGRLVQSGGDLARGLERIFGGLAGKGILLIYMVWFQFLFTLRIRLSAQRLLSGGSRDGAIWFFLFVLGGVSLWMAHGTLGGLGRTAQLFFLVLTIIAGSVLLLSLGRMEQGNWLTVWEYSHKGAAGLIWPGLQAMGYGLFAGFLWEAPVHKRVLRNWLCWCTGSTAVLIGMQLVIMGCFGIRLTESMENPFFHLAKSVGIKGAFQRMESLVTAVWVFSDLLLLAGLLWCIRRIGGVLNPRMPSKIIVTVTVLGGMMIALAAFGGVVSAVRMAQTAVAAGNLFLGVGIPLTAVFILKVKDMKKKDFKNLKKVLDNLEDKW